MSRPPATPDPRRPPGVLYLVATSHLDTQWRWTVRDTIREFLPRTLRQNFEIFDRLPGFVLSFEGAFRYMLVREYYPEQFERLRREVAAGRWHPAGCMLDAPDVNIPSPESLIRQVLYGRLFFERELGAGGVDLFLPDCFGFGAALPSVAAHCGLRGLSTSKLVKWKAPDRVPFAIGRWRGPDGAEIVAALHPEGYGEGVSEDLSRAERWRRRLAELGESSGLYVGLMYAGVGDRGGALDAGSVEWLRKSLAGAGPVTVRMAASDQLFRDLEPRDTERLPLYRGDLLLPTHGTGCLTSQAVMKRWNRRNEQLGDAAERAALAAERLAGLPYPRRRLRQAWTRFLWHQMHDDLTGTSIPAAYRISWNDEIVALNLFAGVLADSVAAVARSLDTEVEGVPLVVFNPLAIGRADPVEARVRFAGETPAAVRVFDGAGDELPAQIVRRGAGTLDLVFVAPLPPVGFAVFEVRPTAAPCALETGVAVAPGALENRSYRAEIDAAGDLARLLDRRSGRELLAAPAGLELLPDRSARWPAWEIRWADLRSPPRERFGAPAAVRVVERGPARVALDVRRSAAGSTVTQRYRLAAGAAGGRLEIETRVEWRSRGRLLKAVFPTPFAADEATYDLGLGVARRGTNRRQRYEVPAQQWADLSSDELGAGLSVLSDAKCGWDKPDDSTLRLSLLRSPRVGRRFRHQAVQDLGPHRFLYALVGHRGEWSAGDTVEQAARLNQPPLAFQTGRSAGTAGRSWSLLAVEPPTVAVRALKAAESGDDLVVRLQETRGEPVDEVLLSLPAPLRSVREADGGERPLGPVQTPAAGGALRLTLAPFQPRTLRLRLPGPEPPRPPSPSATPLPLPLDLVAASFHGRGGSVDFDGHGRSLPGEQLRQHLTCGEARFRLGPLEPDAAHCLACRGQRLELPAGAEPRELALLAVAVGGDRPASFGLDGASRSLVIGDWAEPLGQWVRRRLLWGFPIGRARPPFIRRHRLAWLGTHRHDRRGADEPYVFCYLFGYRLPLPSGGAWVELPAEPRIRIFAATLLSGCGPPTEPAAPLFDAWTGASGR